MFINYTLLSMLHFTEHEFIVWTATHKRPKGAYPYTPLARYLMALTGHTCVVRQRTWRMVFQDNNLLPLWAHKYTESAHTSPRV